LRAVENRAMLIIVEKTCEYLHEDVISRICAERQATVPLRSQIDAVNLE
jgi:hypothetical protein